MNSINLTQRDLFGFGLLPHITKYNKPESLLHYISELKNSVGKNDELIFDDPVRLDRRKVKVVEVVEERPAKGDFAGFAVEPVFQLLKVKEVSK